MFDADLDADLEKVVLEDITLTVPSCRFVVRDESAPEQIDTAVLHRILREYEDAQKKLFGATARRAMACIHRQIKQEHLQERMSRPNG